MIKKTPSWITGAYKGTVIYWAKTQAQIMEMLGSLGIDQIRFTNMPDRFALEFVVKLDEKSIPRAVRVVVPLATKSDDPTQRNRELNIIHRILLNHLKAKFVAIGNGLTEFEQEFMSHLVVNGKDGKSTTMGEAMLPQYRKGLENGDISELKLLG